MIIFPRIANIIEDVESKFGRSILRIKKSPLKEKALREQNSKAKSERHEEKINFGQKKTQKAQEKLGEFGGIEKDKKEEEIPEKQLKDVQIKPKSKIRGPIFVIFCLASQIFRGEIRRTKMK